VPVPRLIGLREGPASLTLVRHGESIGNVADAKARREHADRLDLDVRDADVELSDAGRQQAEALRDWLKNAPAADRPTVVVSSPYRRAADTARIAAEALDGIEVVFDERLRERDLGLFDGLTGQGIKDQHGDEAARRSKVGKFYYQPPSGESWADVVLRVRSLLTDLREGYDDARVWLFTHQAVIMSFRYALEGLDETELLEIDRTTRISNASMTRYARSEDGLVLQEFADDSHLATGAARPTQEPDRTEQAPDA
jgi:broad specificity phosphatase PhoE